MWFAWNFGAVMVVVVVAAVYEEPLHCRDERCQYIGKEEDKYRYEVEGKKLVVYDYGYTLLIYCPEGSVLESSALPRAEPERLLKRLDLECPPPANGSLADTITAFNIKLDYSVLDKHDPEYLGPRVGLRLVKLPPEPRLSAAHFVGLERLSGFKIFAPNRTSPERRFLEPLRNLRSLYLINVDLPTDVLETPPSALEHLTLNYCSGVEQLPIALQSSPYLKYLAVYVENGAFDVGVMPSNLREMQIFSKATKVQLYTAPELSVLILHHWTELRPMPLERCDNLEMLHLMEPVMVSLPNGWLMQCSKLTSIYIRGARNLASLPPHLFIGANALSTLHLTGGVLETLPVELLAYTPNLRILNLEGNRIRMLPSGMFEVPRMLERLDLSSNQLDPCTLDAPALLDHLTYLDVRNNTPPERQHATCSRAGLRTGAASYKFYYVALGLLFVSKLKS